MTIQISSISFFLFLWVKRLKKLQRFLNWSCSSAKQESPNFLYFTTYSQTAFKGPVIRWTVIGLTCSSSFFCLTHTFILVKVRLNPASSPCVLSIIMASRDLLFLCLHSGLHLQSQWRGPPSAHGRLTTNCRSSRSSASLFGDKSLGPLMAFRSNLLPLQLDKAAVRAAVRIQDLKAVRLCLSGLFR